MEKKTYEKECQFCGEKFEASNLKKMYCSNSCKTFASQQRKGKLNKTRKELMTKTKQKEADQLNLLDEIVLALLASEFSISYDSEDYFMKVENVKVYSIGKYILSSTDKELISSLRKKYSGSNVFKGVVKKKTVHIISPEEILLRDFGIESINEGNRMQNYVGSMHNLNNQDKERIQREINKTEAKRIQYIQSIQAKEKEVEISKAVVYCTIVTFEEVVKMSNIPEELT